jgi:hypothetical protein
MVERGKKRKGEILHVHDVVNGQEHAEEEAKRSDSDQVEWQLLERMEKFKNVDWFLEGWHPRMDSEVGNDHEEENQERSDSKSPTEPDRRY